LFGYVKEDTDKYQDGNGKVSKAAEQSFRFAANTEIQEAAALSAATALKKIALSTKKQLKKAKYGTPHYNQLQTKLNAALSMARLENQNGEMEDALDKRVSQAVKTLPFVNKEITRDKTALKGARADESQTRQTAKVKAAALKDAQQNGNTKKVVVLAKTAEAASAVEQAAAEKVEKIEKSLAKAYKVDESSEELVAKATRTLPDDREHVSATAAAEAKKLKVEEKQAEDYAHDAETLKFNFLMQRQKIRIVMRKAQGGAKKVLQMSVANKKQAQQEEERMFDNTVQLEHEMNSMVKQKGMTTSQRLKLKMVMYAGAVVVLLMVLCGLQSLHKETTKTITPMEEEEATSLMGSKGEEPIPSP
jgi:hypothetical protein